MLGQGECVGDVWTEVMLATWKLEIWTRGVPDR